MAGRFYGRESFNPIFIITQILALQSSFYVMLSIVMSSAFKFFQVPMSARHLFAAKSYGLGEQFGPAFDIVFLAVCLAMSPIVATVVERAKKCLDFVGTYHFFHFLVSWISYGFPTTVGFWVSNGLGITVTTLLSEWLCLQNEMQDIQVRHRVAREIEMEGKASQILNADGSVAPSVVGKSCVLREV